MNTAVIRTQQRSDSLFNDPEPNAWSYGWKQQAAYWIGERAYLLHTEGRFQESLTLFEGLAALDPTNLYYLDSISALHLALGNWPDAERYAAEVLAAEPGNVSALVRRCEAYLRLGQLGLAAADLDRIRDAGAAVQARRMEMRLDQLTRPRFPASADNL